LKYERLRKQDVSPALRAEWDRRSWEYEVEAVVSVAVRKGNPVDKIVKYLLSPGTNAPKDDPKEELEAFVRGRYAALADLHKRGELDPLYKQKLYGIEDEDGNYNEGSILKWFRDVGIERPLLPSEELERVGAELERIAGIKGNLEQRKAELLVEIDSNG